MTSPQLPSQPIASPYAIVSNAANGATSGLGEFASWTKGDWDAFLSGKWVPHFDGIGAPVAAAFEWINAIVSAFQGDWGPLEDLVGDVIEGIQASFEDLMAAFQGSYTGTDPALGTIQTIVKALRGGLTGLIDWSRIPQLSLSQLTNQPGPNMLTGFGDFATEETMGIGGGWTWDGSVGGGSARADLDGSRKILTSELVAVAAGQPVVVAGKVRKSAAAGSGNVARLVVVPFIGSTPQPEVVIGGVGAGTDMTGQTVSAPWTVPAGVDGARIRITAEGAGTAGRVWWDDVSLRKTATSLPQQFISGLTSALSELGDDIAGALGWIKDLIEKLTGRARSSIEDAISDILAFGAQLKTILSGGTIANPLPNLAGAVMGSVSTMLNQVLDIFNGIVVVPINGAIGGLKDWVSGIGNQINNAAAAAAQVVIDGMNGVGQFANSIAAAISAAVQAVVSSIFGDGGTKWGQEVLVASGPVVTGPNDIPLGFGMPFSGKITDLAFYTSDNLATSGGSGATIEIRRNGTTVYTATWPGGTNSRTISGLNLSVSKLDRITFWVTSIDSQMANMSISVVGKYV